MRCGAVLSDAMRCDVMRDGRAVGDSVVVGGIFLNGMEWLEGD